MVLSVSAGQADEALPDGGLRLPAGAILERQDPRLAQPAGSAGRSPRAEKRSEGADAGAASAAVGGHGVAGEPVSPTTAAASENPESRQILRRRPGPQGAGRLSGASAPGSASGLGARPLWDALPLGIVLALIAGLAVFVKKYLPAKRLLTGAGVLDVLARLALDNRHSLVLVKMGRRLVLVGVSPERIALLTVVEDADQVAAIVGEAARHGSESISREFAEALGHQTSAYAETLHGQDAVSLAGGSVRGLLEKVRAITRRYQTA